MAYLTVLSTPCDRCHASPATVRVYAQDVDDPTLDVPVGDYCRACGGLVVKEQGRRERARA